MNVLVCMKFYSINVLHRLLQNSMAESGIIIAQAVLPIQKMICFDKSGQKIIIYIRNTE